MLGLTRQPNPGELYNGHMERMDWVDRLASQGGIRRVVTVAELQEAKAKGDPAMIQDVEGCDFLDGKLERIEEAAKRGIRVVQLVHYIPNDIGDFQTGPVVDNGLTEFGAKVVRELNPLGVVIDVAHATEEMTRGVAKATSKPLLLSHTALQGSKAMGQTPLAGRQISQDHARMVAATGGVIGEARARHGLERGAFRRAVERPPRTRASSTPRRQAPSWVMAQSRSSGANHPRRAPQLLGAAG